MENGPHVSWKLYAFQVRAFHVLKTGVPRHIKSAMSVVLSIANASVTNTVAKKIKMSFKAYFLNNT